MGYVLKEKVFNLTFEEYPGFKVSIKEPVIGELMDLLGGLSGLDKSNALGQVDNIAKTFNSLNTLLSDSVVSWNLEDVEGNARPHDTADCFKVLPNSFTMTILNGWIESSTGEVEGTDPLEVSQTESTTSKDSTLTLPVSNSLTQVN